MSLRIWLRALCAASVLGAGALPALAQSPSPSPSPSADPEIGHVQTSGRTSETLQNATKTVHVVSKKTMIERGYRTVADALEMIPGVNVSAYGAAGAAAGVSIRGSSSAQVLILIDGIPAGGAQTGTLDLNSISTSGVDRIEVVEGGGSTLYGTGSIGGIVNIITHPLSGSPVITAAAGSLGERTLRIETKNISFERTVSANTYAYPGGTRSDADSEMTSARFAFARDSGPVTLDFSGGVSAHSLGDPGSVPATFTTPARQRSVDRDVHLGATFNRGHASSVAEIGAVTQQLLYTCDDPSDANCFSPLGALTLDSRVQLSVRNTVTHAETRATYGVDFARGTARIDDGGGASLFAFPPVPLAASISTSAYAQSAAYGQQTWISSDGSRLYLGVRAERDGAQGGVVAPSAGFLKHLGGALTLRANYATAFRAPTAVELYYPGYGTPTLRPERAQVADITLTNPQVLGGVSAGWFGEWAHDLIVTDPASFTARNVGVASVAGVTVQITSRSFYGYSNRLSVTDLYHALDLTPGASNEGGRIFGSGPVFQVTDEFSYAGSAGSFIDSAGIVARSRGAEVAFGTAPAFTRVDAYVRARLGPQMLLALRVYNLGNEQISAQPGFPLPGRSFVLEFSTR